MADYKVHTMAKGINRFIHIPDALLGINEGIKAKTVYRPEAGNSTAQWDPDLDGTSWSTKDKDICTYAHFKGYNGKAHWVVKEFGLTSGIYPQGQIVGFKFDEVNDSTRNHCIFLNRYGYALTKNGTYYFVDAGGVCQQPGDYSRTREHTFNPETKRRLKDGWCFAQFRILLSTNTGGTGERESNFEISNWQFKFAHDGGSGDMIIPENRPYSLREDNKSIGLA
jgi:hypothetical protein